MFGFAAMEFQRLAPLTDARMIGDWDVGTDIGGTFTDIVAVHAATQETRTAKVPSRPDAPVDAMLEAIAAVGLDPVQLRRFVHGTTRITNAIVQQRLPPIALVATAGFEDVLEIARYRRRDLYRLDVPPKAPALVPAERCFGLIERMDHQGLVLLELDDAELDRMADWVRDTGSPASPSACCTPTPTQRTSSAWRTGSAALSPMSPCRTK